MPPKSNPEPKPVTGPPQELISRIEHLRSLLKNLPTSLPENPADSPYCFYLDPDALDDRGYLGELSHALEVSFVTHLRPLQFLQRGSSLDPLPALLKTAVKHMTSAERDVFRQAWLQRLIDAASAAGAKVPPRGNKWKAIEAPAAAAEPSTKKSKQPIINIDSDSDTDLDVLVVPASLPPTPVPSTSSVCLPPPSTSSASRRTPIGNPKQTTLQFAPATKEEVQRYWRNVVDLSAGKRKLSTEEEKRRAEKKKEHEREQGREQQQRKRERDRANAPKDIIPDKRNANKALMNGATAVAGVSAIGDVADLRHDKFSIIVIYLMGSSLFRWVKIVIQATD
ncbi:hypothetical protein B0H13DRAFT_1907360 [Mycena leptocephala]|nr:hypothetical protein B0H13DRAFT_1907360 [Mycena leptocephala]